MNKTVNFQARAEGEGLELMIYDAIGPDWMGMISAKTVTDALNENKDAGHVNVRINSPGGSAFDGIAIHNALRSFPGKVTTVAEGMAASAASVIFMAGDRREMHESAMLMIHDASGVTMGNEGTHRQQADALAKLDGAIASTYANATGGDVETIREMMDEDYWMDSNDALKDGYATDVIVGTVPSAHFDLSILKNVPDQIAERFGRRDQPTNETEHDTMTPDQFKAKHQDVVDGWLNDENAAGYANAKNDINAMIEACGGDVAAGYKAFTDGKSLADARAEHSQSIEQKLADVQAKLEAAEARAAELENGEQPLNLNADAEIENKAGDRPDDSDPKAVAEWEYDNDQPTWKASTRERYVSLRTKELSGGFKVAGK